MRALRHSRVLAPLIAASVATAFVAGGLAAKVHALAKVHAICAEHGGEIHLDEVARGTAVEAPGSLRSAPDGGHAADHDHCQHPVDHRKVADVAEAAVAVAAPPAAIVAPIHGDDLAAVVALYRLAPKTSPPVAAS